MTSDVGSDNPEMTAGAGTAPSGMVAELRKRKVFRVMTAYAVSAWLILQIVDVLAGAFPVPDWTVAFTTMALAIGFRIAAALPRTRPSPC